MRLVRLHSCKRRIVGVGGVFGGVTRVFGSGIAGAEASEGSVEPLKFRRV